MKIYVLSDSHDSAIFAPFLEICQDADMVIHCGDGNRDVDDLKSVLSCPVFSVKGNCDFSGQRELLFDVCGKKIFVTHGDFYGIKNGLSTISFRAKQVKADVVLYGHSHVPDITYKDGVCFINPGSLTQPRGGKVATYCILEITGETIKPALINF